MYGMENNTRTDSDHFFDLDADRPLEDDAVGDPFPDLQGGPEGSLFLDTLDGEVPLQESPVFGEKLNDASSNIISLAFRGLEKRRGQSKKAGIKTEVYITHEDFEEGYERDAFLMIYGHAYNLFEPDTSRSKEDQAVSAARALDFFFCLSDDDVTFEDAANALSNGYAFEEQVRIDVVRLRFMYEFWQRWKVIPTLGPLSCLLPSRVEALAAFHGGIEGTILCKEAWQSPGIEIHELIDRAIYVLGDRHFYQGTTPQESLMTCLDNLLIEYVLSARGGNIYVTGKNPQRMIEDRFKDKKIPGEQATIWWSRLF